MSFMRKNYRKIEGVSNMYESYQWPGAYTLKDEVKIFSKWVIELFDGILGEIKKKENK